MNSQKNGVKIRVKESYPHRKKVFKKHEKIQIGVDKSEQLLSMLDLIVIRGYFGAIPHFV